MLTPKQQDFWNRLSERPVMKSMIERLGLEPVESPEYKRNVEIAKRAEMIIQQMDLMPKTPRKVIKLRKPWEEPDLSWIPKGEAPF